MLLWTRTRQVEGASVRDALRAAAVVAEHASATTGLEVVPWASVYGMPLGTVVHSVRLESQAAMDAALSTLSADEGYQRVLHDHGRAFDPDAGEDAVGEVVSVAGTGGSTDRFVSVLSAQCAPGRLAEATAWGRDVLSHASKVTGLDGVLLRCLYGPWPTLSWISLAESMEEVDVACSALAADGTYLERIDDGGPLFVAASTSQRLLRRLT